MSSAYTPTQLSLWETHVCLPPHFQQSSSPPLDLAYLRALHIHQIAAVPYENLLLHYSPQHAVSLDPQVLFKKIVTDKRGRGGYCMENSILFHHVLRGLGWNVYMAGVRGRKRVDGRPEGEWMGWVHIVNIVTLPTGIRYMIDVGFGGDGATSPIPMLASSPIIPNLGTQEARLIHEPITYGLTSQPVWIYQCRNSPSLPWQSFFCFPETEFLHADFEVMNWYTSTSNAELNFQTRRVLVIRFLREGDRIVGKVMLVDGEVKENLGGRTMVKRVCGTEEERVQVLREVFGITLTEEEILAVRGRNVELGGC